MRNDFDDQVRAARAGAAQKLDAEDRANRSRQGQRTDLVYNKQSDVHEVERPSGNSSAAFIRRLRKDRPDIHARVLSGEITPHAGMIEAGFRRKVERRKKPSWPPPAPIDVSGLIG